MAQTIVDNIFEFSPKDEKIHIGFFGGEPLLEFGRVTQIADYIKNKSEFNPDQVELDIVSNGTIFSEEIGTYLLENDINYCLSCDGPAKIQDRFRKFKNGKGSSSRIERNIEIARNYFPKLLVNAVYQPSTVHLLPEVISYFSSIGITQIYLSPDYSAIWKEDETSQLAEIYDRIGEQYIDLYRKGNPHHISIIDNKISIMLKGGYSPNDHCKMGTGEFAFAPSGNIYPCERLLGADDGLSHCIGNILNGIPRKQKCHKDAVTYGMNPRCKRCSLRDFCMNWCGCSNFFSTKSYFQPGPFLCASEKAAIAAAFKVFRQLEKQYGSSYLQQMISCAPLSEIFPPKNINTAPKI